MNKLFRFVSLLVVLVMVLGFFASPMSAGNQVNAQKEVPTFVVAPTEVPTEEPVVEPTEPPAEELPPGEVPVEEVTPVPTQLPEVVPLIEAVADVAVPGRYIIVFKDSVDKEAARQAALNTIANGAGRVAFEYNSALDGITAEISPDVLRKLRQDGRIDFIEQDQKVHVEDEEIPFSIQTMDSTPDSWGLDRIDGTLDNKFYYPSSAGEGVNIYIIDSGIRNTHENFNGRATLDFDAFNGSIPYGYDCDGHGTHVAGTAAGLYTGVARKANIHSVRVLDCEGWGFTSQIVAGINWVAQNHVKPAVANMSLGGWKSPAEDAAVSKAIAKGVTFVVAAGNDGESGVIGGVDYGNACNYSPARVPGAITVGATNSSDNRASFSNYGKCVDIFAPGDNIYSSVMDSNSSYESGWSGTSMAAPHVTGVAALFLSNNPKAKPAQVTAYIIGNASQNIINDEMGSPDRLLKIPNSTTIPILLTPVNNITIIDPTPRFSWNPVTNADQYVMQLSEYIDFSSIRTVSNNDNPAFDYPITLPDGSYYWRVAAMNVNGTNGPWSLQRKFTVDTTGPAAPVQSQPGDHGTVNGIPTFTWLPSSGAKTYQMAYAQDDTPDDIFDLVFPPITKTQYKPASLPIYTQVYWYVRAIDAFGNPGPWSPSRSVWINPLTPAAPKLLSPANNSGTNDQTPEFTWGSVLYGNFYQIQIANVSNFYSMFDDVEGPMFGGTYTPSVDMPEGKYWWRVRAKNSLGTYGPWSASRSILIDITGPVAPILKTPLNNTDVTGTPTFTWTAPAGARTYIFQYAHTIGYDTDLVTYTNITKPSFKPPTAIPEYPLDTLWRVKAVDAYGNEGEWSLSNGMFINPPTPAKPTQLTPLVKGYVNIDDVTFDWLPVDYAVEYDLQVCYLTNCTSPVYQDTTSNTQLLNLDLSPYLYSGNYSWRVRGTNSDAIDGQWSALRPFTISYTRDFGFSVIDDLFYWEWIGGGWFHNNSDGTIYNNGNVNSENTKTIWKHASVFNDFSAETRLKLDPGTAGSTGGFYGMAVRAGGGINSWGDWNKGYYFGISQENGNSTGCFRIYSLKGSAWSIISGYCDPIIVGNDWNTLSVSAQGKNLRFYINDLLVWQGTDSTYTSGTVGLFNYSYMDDYGSGTPGKFTVDYFNFGAPIMGILSVDSIEPDPSFGAGVDPFLEKRK